MARLEGQETADERGDKGSCLWTVPGVCPGSGLAGAGRPEARGCLTSRIGATDTSLSLAADWCGHLLDEAQRESQWQPPQAGSTPMTLCILQKCHNIVLKKQNKKNNKNQGVWGRGVPPLFFKCTFQFSSRSTKICGALFNYSLAVWLLIVILTWPRNVPTIFSECINCVITTQQKKLQHPTLKRLERFTDNLEAFLEKSSLIFCKKFHKLNHAFTNVVWDQRPPTPFLERGYFFLLRLTQSRTEPLWLAVN